MSLTIAQRDELEQRGLLKLPKFADLSQIKRLRDVFTAGRPQRNALSIPTVLDFVHSSAVCHLMSELFTLPAFAVRAILFEKSAAANWKVAWHQDLTIAVKAKHELVGFKAWSEKAGVTHVQPPSEVMNRMIALRFHLDDNTADSGPLRIIPGSHLGGRLSTGAIDLWKSRDSIECLCNAGDAILMRPLVLHASSPAKPSIRRRVLHVEFADFDLPSPLEWHERVAAICN